MIKTILVLKGLLFVLAIPGLSAQESVIAAGGNAAGSGGTISYSAGQIFYSINVGPSGTVAEGVQQPYEISVISSIEEITGITGTVFPNPAADFLTLRIEMVDGMEISYKLFDIGGRLLEDRRITEIETILYMGRFSPGTYFLKITGNNQDLKTFKIIKQ